MLRLLQLTHAESCVCRLALTDSSVQGGDLSSARCPSASKSCLIAFYIVWKYRRQFVLCVFRARDGVLQQQGHQLQRGGGHHGVRCSMSAVELRPAVQWAPCGHGGCVTPQGPRQSRFLQVCADSSDKLPSTVGVSQHWGRWGKRFLYFIISFAAKGIKTKQMESVWLEPKTEYYTLHWKQLIINWYYVTLCQNVLYMFPSLPTTIYPVSP